MCYGENGVQTRGGPNGAGIQATAGSNNVAGLFLGDTRTTLQTESGSVLVNGRSGLNSITVNTPADGLHGINLLSYSPYSAIVSQSVDGSTAAVWGINNGSGSQGLLGWGVDGVVAFPGSNGYAARLYGRVASGYLGVNLGTDPTYPLDVAQPTQTTTVAGARILADGQTDATTHPSGQYWKAGLEAAGPNGIIGGTSRAGGYGLIGFSQTAIGVYGAGLNASAFNYGVYGDTSSSTNGHGVYSNGRFGATGTKAFVIDHPLDPENKYLAHYCTEGEEPLNVYRGRVTTDAQGFATVSLPEYYDEINIQPTVQLTVMDDSDDFIMAKVSGDVESSRFTIRTNRGNTVVCWRLEARRNDRFVARYGAPVEIVKPAERRGNYQRPELYGYGEDRKELRQPLVREDLGKKGAEIINARPLPKIARMGTSRKVSATPPPKAMLGSKSAGLSR